MFPMTITINNREQLDIIAAALGMSTTAPAAAPAPAAKPAAAKAAPKAEAEKPAPAVAAPASKERTLDEARRLVVALGALHREPTVALLAEYNAKTATQVPADKITEFVGKIEALGAKLGVADLADRAGKVTLK